MNDLQLSAWKPPQQKTSIQRFLRSIGVPFREGVGFWLTNEDQVDYLFHDLCRRGRELKIQLHPQNGGEAQVFSEFVERLEKAKKSFYKHGVRVNGLALHEEQRRARSYENHKQRMKFAYHNKGGLEYHRRYNKENATRIRARKADWYQKRKANKKLAISPVRRETRPECEKG